MSARRKTGRLLVIARDDPADADMARAAARDGANLLRLALLETDPGSDGARLLEWLEVADEGAAVAWTSKRAGEALARLAVPARRDSLSRMSLFAVGAESAAPLRAAGFTVDVPVRAEGAAALAGWMIRRQVESGPKGLAATFARVAFLRGDKALPTLRDGLRRAGIPVDEFEIYRTRFASPGVAPLERALLGGSEVSVVFYSPSGVEALEPLLSPRALKALRERARVTAIGDTTHGSLLARGYEGIQSGKRKYE
ncbi:MAG: uroporphyrinogen-III synthase [Candidatus Eiseniibacteriota bacterium]